MCEANSLREKEASNADRDKREPNEDKCGNNSGAVTVSVMQTPYGTPRIYNSSTTQKSYAGDVIFILVAEAVIISLCLYWNKVWYFLDKHNGAVGAIAALVIMLLTAGYVCISYLTLNSIKQQGESNAKQFTKQLDATNRLITQSTEQATALGIVANAAKKSADIAAGIAIPTLAINEFGFGYMGAAGVDATLQYPTIKIVVKNYGGTTAFIRGCFIKLTCEELPNAPIYPAEGYAFDKVAVDSRRQRELTAFMPRKHWFSTEDIKAIKVKEKIFRVYGYILYGDIFGNPLRRLKFCETLININEDGRFQWVSEDAPTQYRGTD